MPITPSPTTTTTSVENKPTTTPVSHPVSRIAGPKLVLSSTLPTGKTGKPLDLLKYVDADAGNADRLIAHYGHELRYCPDFKRWLLWDGRRWVICEHAEARDKVRATMQAFQILANADGLAEKAKFAEHSQNARPCDNCLSMAEHRLTVRSSALDTHPNMLNFTNGTVALSNGLLYPHDPLLYITKLIHHPYDPNASCPNFLRFLAQIFPNSPDLQSFLLRAFGYAMTGMTPERCIFFCVGTGSNGKSTLLSLFQTLIAEYSCNIKISSLTDTTDSASRSSDLSDLRGVRFARTSESGKQKTWDEAVIKLCTQGTGGYIKVKRMHHDHFDIPETYKIWVDTNHLPKFDSGDVDDRNNQALWSRLYLLPFDACIPDDRQDRDLFAKLQLEAPGILALCVEEAVSYNLDGLGAIPDEVRRAGRRWRAKSDPVASFLKNCTNPCGSVLAGDLHKAYLARSVEENERWPLGVTQFGRRIDALPYVRKGTTHGRTRYDGISLRLRSGRVGITAAEQTTGGDEDE